MWVLNQAGDVFMKTDFLYIAGKEIYASSDVKGKGPILLGRYESLGEAYKVLSEIHIHKGEGASTYEMPHAGFHKF